ncbi:MAG: hypothetical protein FRX49_11671 [Trebouxia sp. A1-2]|nr:MAG: hypothetical protein FRX49_11671 [Trebouxia sp. A1-2]
MPLTASSVSKLLPTAILSYGCAMLRMNSLATCTSMSADKFSPTVVAIKVYPLGNFTPGHRKEDSASATVTCPSEVVQCQGRQAQELDWHQQDNGDEEQKSIALCVEEKDICDQSHSLQMVFWDNVHRLWILNISVYAVMVGTSKLWEGSGSEHAVVSLLMPLRRELALSAKSVPLSAKATALSATLVALSAKGMALSAKAGAPGQEKNARAHPIPHAWVRVEGNSKLKGTAQPFYSLNAPLIVHAPMIFQKQIRPVVRNMDWPASPRPPPQQAWGQQRAGSPGSAAPSPAAGKQQISLRAEGQEDCRGGVGAPHGIAGNYNWHAASRNETNGAKSINKIHDTANMVAQR